MISPTWRDNVTLNFTDLYHSNISDVNVTGGYIYNANITNGTIISGWYMGGNITSGFLATESE